MLKETETEETIVFFMTFLSLVAFQLAGEGGLPPPSGGAYGWEKDTDQHSYLDLVKNYSESILKHKLRLLVIQLVFEMKFLL